MNNINMSFAAFLLVVLIQIAFGSKNGLSDEQNARIQELYENCSSETKVDTKLITQGRHQVFADDENLKKYYLCMFKNLEFIDEDGNLILENILANLPMERKPDFDDIITKCVNETKGDTPMDLVFEANKCFTVKINQEYIFE